LAKKMSAALAAAMTPIQPTQDKLEALRNAVRRQRDLQLEIRELQQLLSDKNKALSDMEMRELPDLFYAAGVDSVGITAEGNLPAYDATMRPFYHANIKADWPDEQKSDAFKWLDKEGHGDLIKTMIKVELGRGERKQAIKLEKALQEMGIDYSSELGVPWNTLTAFVKEQIEKHQTVPPLDLLGASVGTVVKLKERK
jgi:hypothetical protein